MQNGPEERFKKNALPSYHLTFNGQMNLHYKRGPQLKDDFEIHQRKIKTVFKKNTYKELLDNK